MTSSVYKRLKAVSLIIQKSSVVGILTGLVATGISYASGQVSSIQTSPQGATPFTYTAGGVEYHWGMGQNQLLEGFTTTDGQVFSYAASADRVELMRDDITGVTTGEPCGIFVERLSEDNTQRTFAADYPSDGSGTGNCDIASMLASRVVNRGAVDLFSNTLPDAKNIERLDYIFDSGVLAPFTHEAMALAGHLASEKASNNPIKIAAILKLDVLGQPLAYGPLQLIGANGCSDPDLCYGITDLQHTYSFLQNDFTKPQSFPVETEQSHEYVGMAFVSATDLGLNPGQIYYGFSFFADDVDVAAGHDLLNPATFPDDTSADHILKGDDADIYGGLSGYFLGSSLTVATGAVFNDVNANGVRDTGEAGISDIRITVFEDINGSGVLDLSTSLPLGDSIDSDVNGDFVLPGIPDGNYLVVMDESDPELPPGLVSTPGANIRILTISGADPDPVFFPFVNPLDSSFQDETASTPGSGSPVDASGNPGTGGAGDGADGAMPTDNSDGTSGDGTDGAIPTDNTNATPGDSTDGAVPSDNTDATPGDAADGGISEGGTEGSPGNSTDGISGDSSPNASTDQLSTFARADSFAINQGSSGTIDVLANDVDGAGGGLTLISVSDSSNAAISIANNEVVYRPNFGFYGLDTFLYTFEDVSGMRLTGNVEVDVIRYSDINENGTNDFDECDCTDLTFQTGVNGAGIGQFSLVGFLVMMLSVFFRRRSLRCSTKRRVKGRLAGAK